MPTTGLAPFPLHRTTTGWPRAVRPFDRRARRATGLRGRWDREVRRFSPWARAARRAPRVFPAPRAAARRRAGPRACDGTAAAPCEAGRRPPGPASMRCEGCCTRRLLSLRGPVRLGLAALLKHDATSATRGGRATQGGGRPHLEPAVPRCACRGVWPPSGRPLLVDADDRELGGRAGRDADEADEPAVLRVVPDHRRAGAGSRGLILLTTR